MNTDTARQARLLLTVVFTLWPAVCGLPACEASFAATEEGIHFGLPEPKLVIMDVPGESRFQPGKWSRSERHVRDGMVTPS